MVNNIDTHARARAIIIPKTQANVGVWNNKDRTEEEEVGTHTRLTAGRETDPDTRLMLTMPIILRGDNNGGEDDDEIKFV